MRLELELVLAPALVGGSTLACRRWNERIGGLLSAFPAVVGPVLLITAQERGVVFAARAANGTLLGLAALGAFAITYGRAASHARWCGTVVVAWACAALLGAIVGWLGSGLGFPAGLGVAVISLVCAYAAMPSCGAAATLTRRPGHSDGIVVRMVVTAAVVAALATAADMFGPPACGMLAALPVLAVFTHRRDGPSAVVALLSGMLSRIAGFVGFCAVVSPAGEPGCGLLLRTPGEPKEKPGRLTCPAAGGMGAPSRPRRRPVAADPLQTGSSGAESVDRS